MLLAHRALRNALKKLVSLSPRYLLCSFKLTEFLLQNSTAKVDATLAENPGKSLDELVAEKKINTDQKAQALKKPALQANVAQVEEQISQYKQFAAHYEERLASQKAALEKEHKEKLESFRENAVNEATDACKKEFGNRLLTLSKFLCAAAAMRMSGDETSGESRAFEGVLYQVYGGSAEAVTSMLKLIDGVDEKVPGVEGDTLDFTCRSYLMSSVVFLTGL